MILTTDVSGNSKIDQTDAIGPQKYVRGLYIQLPHVVGMTMRHCSSHATDDGLKIVKGALLDACAHILVTHGDCGIIKSTQVCKIKGREPLNNVIAIAIVCS